LSCAWVPTYRTVQTSLEFEFNVEAARNPGVPLVPVVVGQGQTVRRILDSVRILVNSLEAKNCDILSVFVNRVTPGLSIEENRPAGPGDRKRIAEAAGNPASVPAVGHLVPIPRPIHGGHR